VGKRESRIDGVEKSHKMIFKSANGPFGGIHTMDFGRDTLVGDFVLEEGAFELLRAFVIQNVELGGVTLMNKNLMRGFPCSANGSSLTVRNRNSVDGVGVLMVEYEDIVVATAGGSMKTTSLVGI
jgi:hypothetical protein